MLWRWYQRGRLHLAAAAAAAAMRSSQTFTIGLNPKDRLRMYILSMPGEHPSLYRRFCSNVVWNVSNCRTISSTRDSRRLFRSRSGVGGDGEETEEPAELVEREGDNAGKGKLS